MSNDVRLGRDWPAISHLTYWRDQHVDEYLMSLLASYENFQHVSFGERWGVTPSRIQKLMGRWVAGAVDPNDPDGHLRGIMAFRAATKTAVASNVCAWLTLLDPRISVKVVSGKDDLAKKITKECRIWYDTVEVLRTYLHPELNTGSAVMMDNANSFNVPGNPGGKDTTFSAVAISGNITGSRAHIVLMDDIEHPKNCDTASKREQLRREDAEANNILFDAKACAHSGILYSGFKPFKLYLGTPHNEESIYTAKQKQGYRFRIWPARYPNKKFMTHIGSMLCPELAKDINSDPKITTGYGLDLQQGKVVDPMRQSEESVCAKETEEGTAGFAKQYMLDVSLQDADKYPLKVNDLIVADLDPEHGRTSYMSERAPEYELKDLPCVGLPGDRFYRPSYMSDMVAPYERIVMAVDVSGRGPDETAYAIVATLNGNFFLLDAGGFAGYGDGYGDTVLEAIADAAKAFKVTEIVTESNFGDGMFDRLLRPILESKYPVPLRESRASGQKELRIIETIEKVLSRRKLIVNRSVIQGDYDVIPMGAKETERPTYRMIHQLARITRDKGSLTHDDRIDALELALRTLIESLGIDQKEAESKKLDAYYRRLAKPGGIFEVMGRRKPKNPPKLFSRR